MLLVQVTAVHKSQQRCTVNRRLFKLKTTRTLPCRVTSPSFTQPIPSFPSLVNFLFHPSMTRQPLGHLDGTTEHACTHARMPSSIHYRHHFEQTEWSRAPWEPDMLVSSAVPRNPSCTAAGPGYQKGTVQTIPINKYGVFLGWSLVTNPVAYVSC